MRKVLDLIILKWTTSSLCFWTHNWNTVNLQLYVYHHTSHFLTSTRRLALISFIRWERSHVLTLAPFLCCVTECPLEGECLTMPVFDQASEGIRGERPAERNSWEAAMMPSAADSHFRWVLALYVCVCVCVAVITLRTFFSFYSAVNFARCTENMRPKGSQSIT